MNKLELKKTLLLTGVFKECNYLDMYTDLIVNNMDTPKIKNETERHHILPKVYFRYIGIPIDNSINNMVNLHYCDHVLAHCLLALSFNNKYLESSSIDGIYAVLNSFDIYKSLDEFVDDYSEVKDVLKCNHVVSDSQKIILSKISSCSRWYNNGIVETFTSEGCPNGYTVGRLKRHNNKIARKKLSDHFSKCRWYNNGIKSTFAVDCPDGWVPGRIVTKALKEANKYNAVNGLGKSVKCVETETIYYSINDAARSINRSVNTVRASLDHSDKTAGGYHFVSV